MIDNNRLVSAMIVTSTLQLVDQGSLHCQITPKTLKIISAASLVATQLEMLMDSVDTNLANMLNVF